MTQDEHQTSIDKNSTDAVVRVGDGRGFIVEPVVTGIRIADRYVITAAHCLPTFPPSMVWSQTSERTYPNLLDTLGGAGSIWAECVFVDPIADLAVLTEPDDQELGKEAEAFKEFTESKHAVPITDLTHESQKQGSVLTLNDGWVSCSLDSSYGSLSIQLSRGHVQGGMSGSPVLNEAGAAISVLSCSSGDNNSNEHTNSVGLPFLCDALPGWLLRVFGLVSTPVRAG